MLDSIDPIIWSKRKVCIVFCLTLGCLVSSLTLLCHRTKQQASRSQPSLFASQNFLYPNNNNPINADLGPLTAFTEEPVNVIKEAGVLINDCKELRNQSRVLVKESLENIRQINKSVNEAFIKKIEETLALSVIWIHKMCSTLLVIWFRFIFSKNRKICV